VDTLVVWKIDRLGRSLKQFIEVAQKLEKWEVDIWKSEGSAAKDFRGRLHDYASACS